MMLIHRQIDNDVLYSNVSMDSLSLYERILNSLNAYKAQWLGDPEMRQAVNALRELLTKIELTANQQIEGYVDSEKVLIYKQQMAILAVTLGQTASMYISNPRNTIKKTVLGYTFKDIYLNTHQVAINRSQSICDCLDILFPHLAGSGIFEEDIKKLQKAIDRYKQFLSSENKSEAGAVTVYTQELTELFEDADQLLESKLDKLMLIYAETIPDFYKAYIDNRIA